MKIINAFTLLAAAITVLAFSAQAGAGLKIVTTLPDFASIATEIGGDRVSVESLVKGTEDPHFVDPKPSFMLKVGRADLLIVIGMGLEDGWLPALLNGSRNVNVLPGQKGYLDASKHVTLLESPTVLDRALGDIHAGGNPHYYISPIELEKVAKAIHERLKELDPAGAAYYDERMERFEARYKVKMAEWEAAAAPLKGARVVVYHKSWPYLESWLGLAEAGALEPKPGIPPSSGHIAGLISEIRGKGVRFVIQEIYQPSGLSKEFASRTGARLVVLPSMVGAEPGIRTIWDKFDRIIAILMG